MKKLLFLIVSALIGLGIHLVSLSSSNVPSPIPIIVNSGLRDLNNLGSAWEDVDGITIGDIRLESDFLRVLQESNIVNIVDKHGKTLYTLDLGSWVIGNISLQSFFKSNRVKGYYFDWLSQGWVVWRRGVGMPDFNHPAFRQAFKWMLCIPIDGRFLNVTFYMTNHDPYLRIFINSSVVGVLTINVEPSPLIRMGLKANISDYSKHLLNWNQATSKLHGNPWASPAWSDTAQGFIGQIFIMYPSGGVEIKKLTDYYQDLNRFVQGHAYNHFNWMENRSENWYSFEFYIRNEKDYAQDIILENYVPDEVYRVDVSYYDGDDYISIGTWNPSNFSSTVNFIDPLGYSHYFRVHEPISIGGRTSSGLEASGFYGVAKRVLMELNLSKGYINNPNIFGGSQLRLRFRFYYNEPGYATYIFSNDHHSKYGLANMFDPYIILYNYTMYDNPLFVSANYTKALFYIRSDDDSELIKEVGFKIDLSKYSGYIFSLGYDGEVDTWSDADGNGVPDLFEAKAFQWSGEKLADVSRASLAYYDILNWNYSEIGMGLVENYIELDWHGSGIKLFGIGTPYGEGDLKCECLLSVVRNLDGYQHLLVQVDNYVEFKTAYNVRKIYVKQFSFGYETSVLSIVIKYETESGYPYAGYTVTQVMDLVRRIYRVDEIPEGRRNMPDTSYWRIEVFRNGSVDTDNWYIDLRDDLLMRWDSFTEVSYIIEININPTIEVYIDYDTKILENNLDISFDYGYYWDKYFNQASAYQKVGEVGFVMARRHLFTLYKGIRWPPSPCIEWDPINHRSKGYDWSMLDLWINGVVHNWSLIPLMSIGGPKYHHVPKNMPKIPLGRDRYLPVAEDFAQYFADVTEHIVVDLNISPIYLEVMNEPYLPNDTVAQMYVEMYNTVRRKVAEVLSQYNKSLGRDVFLGINYIDRFPNFKKPFFYYVLDGVDDLEFASVHIYPGGWGHPFSPWVNNPNHIFFPPNNQYGWFTDEVVINRTYEYTYMHGIDPRVSFHDMKRLWRERFGHDLILMVTEANLNSAWENGSDPRQQNLISAVVHAIMLKNYALGNFSQYFFFQLASMHGPDSPMYKYGGFGLAIMNYTPPHEPFAPYLVAYLWGNYMVRGSPILGYEISNPDFVDVLPIRVGMNYRIWLINKVDSAATITINIPSADYYGFYEVKMHIVDVDGYQQRYDPQLDRVVFGKREIRNINLGIYPSSGSLSIKMKGYSVAVIEFKLKRYTTSIPIHPIWKWFRYIFPLFKGFWMFLMTVYNGFQRISLYIM